MSADVRVDMARTFNDDADACQGPALSQCMWPSPRWQPPSAAYSPVAHPPPPPAPQNLPPPHNTHSTPPAPAGRTHSNPPAHRLEGPRYCSLVCALKCLKIFKKTPMALRDSDWRQSLPLPEAKWRSCSRTRRLNPHHPPPTPESGLSSIEHPDLYGRRCTDNSQ